MKTLSISQVSDLTGLTAATIRFYESKGLINPISRKGLTRMYSPDVLTHLSLIILAKQAQFSLDEIVGILGKLAEKGIERPLLRSKIDEIDQKIQELQKLKQGLIHVEQCTAENHLQCPKFQKILSVSLKHNIAKLTKNTP